MNNFLKHPYISVIVPNFNHASYLVSRIESIFKQTYDHYEVILLDDKSSDHSLDIINLYREHPKVKAIIINESNSGSTFKQWQKGIALAQGEWIWIAESDDYCEPSFLANLMDGIQQNAKCVLGYCQTLIVDNEQVIMGKSESDRLNQYLEGHEFIRTKMAGYNGIYNASMAIFKKEAAISVSDSFQQYKYCGDWLFWVQIALQGEVFISGKYLSYFRRHYQNVTSNATKEGLDFLEGNKIFHFIQQSLGLDGDARQRALKQRIVEYQCRKLLFADTSVLKSVRKSMFALDGKVRRMMFISSIQQNKKKLKIKVRRLLRFPR